MQLSVILAFFFSGIGLGKKFESRHIAYIAPSYQISSKVAQEKEGAFPGMSSGHIIEKEIFPYCEKEDKRKVNHLIQSLYEKKKYLWCVRGGYGSARLFKALNDLTPPPEPRVIIGFSDITFLHLFLNQKWGWKTIHGAMPGTTADQDSHNFRLIKEIMDKKKGTLTYGGLTPLNTSASTQKKICGTITGGCLTLLVNSLGTGWQLSAGDKILMIEDVGVRGYEIDRNLTHLKQSGVLKGVQTIVFGSFLPKDDDKYCPKALETFAREIKIPVFSCNWFGHSFKNYPVPFGCPAKITKQEQGVWVLDIDYDFS
jgi:muramoyltetrapeptide carboxypeptidase